MTHAQPRSPATLREVLYEFAMAREVPDAELLDEFARQHPQYADTLTDFAVELVVDSLRSEAVELAVETQRTSPAVSRAMSRFHDALHGAKARAAAAAERVQQPALDNPFARYGRNEFRQLVRDLRVNSIFACKLRDGLIDPRTMSRGFVAHLAEAMKVRAEEMAAYLNSLRPSVQAGQFCKSDEKPQAGGQQTFEEAVKSSGLTDEQQRFLLGL